MAGRGSFLTARSVALELTGIISTIEIAVFPKDNRRQKERAQKKKASCSKILLLQQA
jgi:hypothetical protein